MIAAHGEGFDRIRKSLSSCGNRQPNAQLVSSELIVDDLILLTYVSA